MQIETLRKIGLTEGEIRVYEALIKLGKSSTGPIMEKSGISSSKVYLILQKLIQKGFISFVVENNIKKFQPANPKNIIEYLDKKQEEIQKTKKDASRLISEINNIIGKHEEESAQIYKGFAGVRAAFENILDGFKKDKEILFFSVSDSEFTDRVKLLMDNFHAKRVSKKIKAKGIFDERFKEKFKRLSRERKLYELKFSKLSLPSSIIIGKDRIILTQWEESPIAFEIISKRIAEKHRNFFYELWEEAT